MGASDNKKNGLWDEGCGLWSAGSICESARPPPVVCVETMTIEIRPSRKTRCSYKKYVISWWRARSKSSWRQNITPFWCGQFLRKFFTFVCSLKNVSFELPSAENAIPNCVSVTYFKTIDIEILYTGNVCSNAWHVNERQTGKLISEKYNLLYVYFVLELW